METGIGMERLNPERCSPLSLAYLGDAVYELRVREHLMSQGLCQVQQLHRASVTFVCANMQARLARLVEPELSPTEVSVMHRGRNAKGRPAPKNTPVVVYRQATGLEALVGYWYLLEAQDRLDWLYDLLWQLQEDEGEE